MQRVNPLWLAVAGLLTAAGCNPIDIATRGYKEVKGTEAEIRIIQDLPAAEMAEYAGIHISRVYSSIGDLVPADFVADVDRDLRAGLEAVGNLPGRRKALLLVADITYYQTEDTASVLLGKTKMAVMHVTVTTAGGKRVADILAIASSEALRTGNAEMAASLARRLQLFQAEAARLICQKQSPYLSFAGR